MAETNWWAFKLNVNKSEVGAINKNISGGKQRRDSDFQKYDGYIGSHGEVFLEVMVKMVVMTETLKLQTEVVWIFMT